MEPLAWIDHYEKQQSGSYPALYGTDKLFSYCSFSFPSQTVNFISFSLRCIYLEIYFAWFLGFIYYAVCQRFLLFPVRISSDFFYRQKVAWGYSICSVKRGDQRCEVCSRWHLQCSFQSNWLATHEQFESKVNSLPVLLFQKILEVWFATNVENAVS